MSLVVVEDYNPQWPAWFKQLAAAIWPAVSDVALSVEHVGSTAVPGLAAKPVIDMDVVVRDAGMLAAVIGRLTGLGYSHRGDLGITGREAFRAPAGSIPHHLYACLEGNAALRNHRLLRDHLLRSTQARDAYAALKRQLAAVHPGSIDAYGSGKTAFITGILEQYMAPDDVAAIFQANQKVR